MDSRLKKLEALLENLAALHKKRETNKRRLAKLFGELELDKKLSLDELFEFSALNVTGIWLQEDNFAQVQPGRYVQLIAIPKSKKGSKSVNLRYFGRAEKLPKELIEKISEFVVRWRFEKAFLNLEQYERVVQRFEREVG